MHTEYLTGGASLLLALQRENAVKHLSGLLGPDDPKQARKASSFYWRAVFGSDPIANGLHGSETYQTAVRETTTFFNDGLCCKESMDSKADEVGLLTLMSRYIHVTNSPVCFKLPRNYYQTSIHTL